MKWNTEKAAKYIWEKYLEQNNNPPEGIPRDPEKVYGEDFKGWVWFLIKVTNRIRQENK